MPRLIFSFAIVFVILGIGAYLLTGAQSLTALIPLPLVSSSSSPEGSRSRALSMAATLPRWWALLASSAPLAA